MTATLNNPAPYVSLEEAAVLEEKSYQAYKKSLRRRKIILCNDPEDQRRKQVPVSALTARAFGNYARGQAASASTLPAVASAETRELAVATQSENKIQPFLPFHQPTTTERELTAAIPPAIPKHQRPYVERWAGIVGEVRNGTWRKHRGEMLGGVIIQKSRSFIRALAKVHGVGVSNIYATLAIVRDLEHDPSREPASRHFAPRTAPPFVRR